MDVEGILANCVAIHAAKTEDSSSSVRWNLVAANEHCFRLHLQRDPNHAAATSSSSSVPAGSPLIELDVSLPLGFSNASREPNSVQSFLATLPGSASHHASDLNSMPHSALPKGANGQSAPAKHLSGFHSRQRSREFSESEWERVQDALQYLNERLDKVAADEAAKAGQHDAESLQMQCILSVLAQVDRFGEQVMRIFEKKKGSPTKHGQFRGKRRQLEDGRDSQSTADSDHDMDDASEWSGDDASPVLPLHLLAIQAEAECALARKRFQGAASFSSATLQRSAALASSHDDAPDPRLLLCWCSVAVYSENQAVLLCLDIHSLAAGHLNAVEGLGLSRKHPLLLVLLRYAGSVWHSWTPDSGNQVGLAAPTNSKQRDNAAQLPRPEEIWVFQADTVEEAQERVERSMRFSQQDRMVRVEVPLEWWGTMVPAKQQPKAEADDQSSDEEEGDEEMQIDLVEGGKIEWDTWVSLVSHADWHSLPKGSKRLRREALERAARKTHLVVQDQVKEKQRRALEKTIPSILEAWFASKGPAGASGAQGQGPLPAQAMRLMGPTTHGEGANGNGLVSVLLHLANKLRSLHRLCPSCGQHLPVASARLRSCPNPLCLYTSEELGPNMSILSELITSLEVADLQLDLAAAAADVRGRDVFEPFPSALLKGKDQERGRAGWFEKDNPSHTACAPERQAGWQQAPGPAAAARSGSSKSLANKDMDIICDLIRAAPPLEPLMKSTSTESSLKLQLSAVWLWRQIRGLPRSTLEGGQEPPALQPFQLYDFLRFVLFTNRLALMPLAGTPHAFKKQGPSVFYHFMVLNESPEREQHYRQKKAEPGTTSYFAFHGSRTCNWFSILRNGLRCMSSTEYMSAGAAYGEGIYLSPDAAVSLGYCQPMMGRPGSSYGSFECMAICEVLSSPRSSPSNARERKSPFGSCRSIIVIPKAESANVFVRYLLVLGEGHQVVSWRIAGGDLLQGPEVGGINLAEHMRTANDAHVRQLQAEKEVVWAERIGLARLSQRRSAVVAPSRSVGSDDGMYAESDSEEDEQFEYSEGSDANDGQSDDDIVEMDAKAWETAAGHKKRASPSPARKAARPGKTPASASSMQPPVGPPLGVSPQARGPSINGSRASASGHTPGLPNRSASHPAKSTAPPPPAPLPAANGAPPPHNPGGSSKSRSQTAQKAVQMELRKINNLQVNGNDTLPTGSFELDLPDESDLFCWRIRLRPIVFKDSTLEPDLHEAARRQGVPEVPVTLEILFPDDFPFQPPFVRVVSPRFRFHTGHITVGGSICMELLTASGWSPAYTLEAVIVQIVAEMCHGQARLDTGFMGKGGSSGEYSMQEAKSAFTRVAAQHGWKT